MTTVQLSWTKLCFDFVAVISQWQSASDEDWALALAREAVIRPLTDRSELTEGLVATPSAELGISRSLVYRLVAKFRRVPQVSSLLPGKRGRKASACTLSVAAEAVVRDAIANVSEKTSALTLIELERWLALQIGAVYHLSVHSSLLKPPAAHFDRNET